MGMFDRLYDTDGVEWQTKAYDCSLDRYQLGDRMPGLGGDYQVEIIGGPGEGLTDSLATVRAGVLVTVGSERVPSLPLIGYDGDPA